MTEEHEGFTRMLFVDAIVGVVGVGFPVPSEVAEHATRGGLAHRIEYDELEWERPALENLSTETLQDLYISLKTYEVTHAR